MREAVPRLLRLAAQWFPTGSSAGSSGLAGSGRAGTPGTLVYRWRRTWTCAHKGGRGASCVRGTAGMGTQTLSRQRDGLKGRSRQAQSDETTRPRLTDSSKFRHTDPDSWTNRARSGRHSAGHTDRAAAPGTPAFLGALPGSSDLPRPPGWLRPAGPPALPKVQADRGRIQGAGCAEEATSGGRWAGPALLSRCVSRSSQR